MKCFILFHVEQKQKEQTLSACSFRLDVGVKEKDMVS